MTNQFSLEIKKKLYFKRIQKDLLNLVFFIASFIILAFFLGNQKTYLERVLSGSTFFLIITIIFLPFILLRWKKSIYKIQISQDGILLNCLQFNKELVYQINYDNLNVKVGELVNRFGKLEYYEIEFTNGKGKYKLNKNGEWSFFEIHQIICELENVRKYISFSIDGFHFKKDIEERMKNDNGKPYDN